MGKRVKVSVIYKESIRAVYGVVYENKPLKIEFENTSVFENCDLIIYPCIKDNEREIYILKTAGINGNIVEFNAEINITDKFFKNHYIEFFHDFTVREFTAEEREKYNHMVSRLNIQELNSTASRLKEVYSRDDVENRELISFLIDINAKIDELLYILKPREEIEGGSNFKSIMLGEEGIFFISNKIIEKENVMIYTTIRDSGGFFSFAAICKVYEFIRYGDYIIYKGLFCSLNADTEDKIIKYIFRLEREMLKEATR